MRVELVPARTSGLPRGVLVPVLAGTALLAAFVALQRHVGRHDTICVWKNLTGLPCPACGGTRLVLDLADGAPLAALRENPLVFALLACAVGAGLLRVLARRRVVVDASRAERRLAWLVGLLAIAGNWAFLIVDRR